MKIIDLKMIVYNSWATVHYYCNLINKFKYVLFFWETINSNTWLWWSIYSTKKKKKNLLEFTSISACGVWRVRAEIQFFKRELHTYIHLDYVKVKFLSCIYILKKKVAICNETFPMYKKIHRKKIYFFNKKPLP